MRWTLDFVRLS